MDKLSIRAYGKLNLYLDITGRRQDGYHLLRSVMQSVSVYDTLDFELTPGEGIEIICDLPGFPLDSSNLICKAWELYFRETKASPKGRLTVRVDKQIPSMAGMAGGSADGAAALTAINILQGNLLDSDALRRLGSKLGADVPFTLFGGTLLCEGIGEALTKIDSVNDLYFTVVRPNVSISTPAAYKAYDAKEQPKKKSFSAFAEAVRIGEPQLIAGALFNALEAAIEEPEIEAAKQKLLEYGALGAQRTGSGSAVFGIFADRQSACRCIERMVDYPFAKVLEPVEHGLEIMR